MADTDIIFLTEDYFPTETSKDNSRKKNIQIIFNSILQNRKQLQINLSGSQITYVLNFFINAGLDFLIFNPDLKKEKLQEILIRNLGEKIISYRRQGLTYLNENISDVFLNLLLGESTEEKLKILKNSSLLRNLKFSLLEELSKDKSFAGSGFLNYLVQEYKIFKNLVIGNFIRFAFQEVNLFLKFKNEELKFDYFNHLILYIDKTIDKYDATKGTLSTFISNWFQDARLSFRKDNSHLFFETSENFSDDKEDSFSDELNKHFSSEHSSLKGASEDKTLNDIDKDLLLKIKEHSKMFPEIWKLISKATP